MKGALLGVLLILGFALPEAAARVFEFLYPSPPFDSYGGFNPDRKIFVDDGEGWLRTSPQKSHTFPIQRFRKIKDPGTFRLLVLGESSVFHLWPHHDYLKSLTKKRFPSVQQVEIVNAGGLSWGSHRLALVARELAGLNPDRVFIYMGHNEYEEVEQLTFYSLTIGRVLELAHHSALVRVATRWLAGRAIEDISVAHRSRTLSGPPNIARAWQHQFRPEDISIRANAFRANLNSILDAFVSQGIPVSLGSVATNLRRPYLTKPDLDRFAPVEKLILQGEMEQAKLLAQTVLRKAVGRHQASDIENEIIRELARRPGVVLADVESEISLHEPRHMPGETLFKDHCHLNSAGNRILIRTFVSTL